MANVIFIVVPAVYGDNTARSTRVGYDVKGVFTIRELKAVLARRADNTADLAFVRNHAATDRGTLGLRTVKILHRQADQTTDAPFADNFNVVAENKRTDIAANIATDQTTDKDAVALDRAAQRAVRNQTAEIRANDTADIRTRGLNCHVARVFTRNRTSSDRAVVVGNDTADVVITVDRTRQTAVFYRRTADVYTDDTADIALSNDDTRGTVTNRAEADSGNRCRVRTVRINDRNVGILTVIQNDNVGNEAADTTAERVVTRNLVHFKELNLFFTIILYDLIPVDLRMSYRIGRLDRRIVDDVLNLQSRVSRGKAENTRRKHLSAHFTDGVFISVGRRHGNDRLVVILDNILCRLARGKDIDRVFV